MLRCQLQEPARAFIVFVTHDSRGPCGKVVGALQFGQTQYSPPKAQPYPTIESSERALACRGR